MAYNSQYTGAQIDAGVAGGLNAVPASRTVNGKALSADITLSADDVGAADASHTHTAAEVGAAAPDHTHTASEVGAVPAGRTVNGKALSADIALTAGDVGAAGSSHTHTASEVGAVPTGRTVNGKALSADITLSASDVGAAAANHTHSSSGSARFASGRYRGTGTAGIDNKVTLTFSFAPSILIIAREGATIRAGTRGCHFDSASIAGVDFGQEYIILVKGATEAALRTFLEFPSNGSYQIINYSLGRTTTFYSTGDAGSRPVASGQYNASGSYYNYFAIG